MTAPVGPTICLRIPSLMEAGAAMGAMFTIPAGSTVRAGVMNELDGRRVPVLVVDYAWRPGVGKEEA